MSSSFFSFFHPSAFPPDCWHPEKPQDNTGLTWKDRCNSILVDLSRQILPFVGACVATAIFIRPQDKGRFFLLAVVCLTGHIGGRILSHVCHYHHEQDLIYPTQSRLLKVAEHVIYILSQVFMAGFYVMTISRVVHELGQSITALMLFQSPTPRITIGFWTSSTEFIPKHLTPLGEKIGWAYSKALMAVAGSIAILLHDLSLIQYGHDNKEKDKMLSTQTYLRVFISTLRVLGPVAPLFHNGLEKSGERYLGFHPIAEAIGFFAIPILYHLSLFASDAMNERQGTMHFKPRKKE